MIPKTSALMAANLQVEEQTSVNYKMFYADEKVVGTHGGLSAMAQVVYKILNTERYRHAIYSKNYGVELADLFGEPVSYVCPEIERRVTEALLQDERISAVSDFYFEINKRKVGVIFTVTTNFGDLESGLEVDF